MRHLILTLFSVATLFGVSCIENDIPYPVVTLNILGVEGPGFSVSEINATKRTVTLQLDEQTDIRSVRIDQVSFDAATNDPDLDKQAMIDQIRTSCPLTGTFDMRTPIYVTLSLYQDYEWTIRAEQPIERYFTVAGQIGGTVIDASTRTATAYVAMGTDRSKLPVLSLKLGPAEISTYSPTLEELSGSSFESVRFVDVTAHGITERWMLYVLTTEVKIALQQIDLWNNTATITALTTPEEYDKAELQYRIKGTPEWKKTQKGPYADGVFSAEITPKWISGTNPAGLPIQTLSSAEGLFANHTYEFRLVIDGEEREIQESTMLAGDKIPDGNMKDASLSCFTTNNKEAIFWGSGNNSFTSGLCRQATFDNVTSAKLTATSAVGILASGNLFSGQFEKQGLSTGVVSFGQPYNWTARPSAMKVQYYAEHIGIVNIDMHPGAPIGKGDQDKARIFVAIVDWNTRRQVSSGTGLPTGTWDPEQMTSTEEGKIIAYGSLFIDASSTGGKMIDAELPLHFYDQTAKPSGRYQVIISCSTSAYGDFMVGCKENVLYVSNFEWKY